MFQITKDIIDTDQLKNSIGNDEAGALVVFEGWVRNHNEGKRVSALEYEVFESLAVKEAGKVIEEAKEKFDILDVFAIHRVGHMAVGDIAVWIGVNSKHREAGFHACRYVIDEIKLRLPIWKKEHYEDGNATWVNCQGCYRHAHIHYSEKEYYEKQLRLKNFGEEGQSRLRNSKVLIVGAGGLGCPALTYLASAGVGKITICDGDLLEISNLHRQTLYSYDDIGEYKSILAKKRLNALNPFITVDAFTHRVDIENIKEIISQHDLVLDCTDNFETKFMLHDTCFFLRKPLVQASIYQDEGQLQSFDFASDAGCLRCIWPDIPEQGCVGNCVDVGVLGVVPGVLGTMQATEAIKKLLNWQSSNDSKTLLVDLMSWNISFIKRTKNSSCPLCGETPSIKDLVRENYGLSDIDIDLSKASDKEIGQYKFIDIRESNEQDLSLPWEKFLERILPNRDANPGLISSTRPVMLVCQRGIRSKKYAHELRDSGAKQIFSLKGGISSVRENWDKIQSVQCQ